MIDDKRPTRNRTLSASLALAVSISVTLPATAQAPQRSQPQTKVELAPHIKILQTLLYGEISVDFQHTQARDAINFIGTALGINIIGRYSDDQTAYGIDPETEITLRLNNMNALDILEMVLEQCEIDDQCTWQLRQSYLEVGTRERLASPSAQQIKIYPVDELLLEVPDFDDAPSFRLEAELAVGYPAAYSYGGGGGAFRNLYGPYTPNTGGTGGGMAPNGMRMNNSGVSGGISIGGSAPTRGNSQQKVARINELIDLITSMVEPDMWERAGGLGATIRYKDGALVVRAPEFIQRQLGGYSNVPPPARTRSGAGG